jgi:hypothetical protein
MQNKANSQEPGFVSSAFGRKAYERWMRALPARKQSQFAPPGGWWALPTLRVSGRTGDFRCWDCFVAGLLAMTDLRKSWDRVPGRENQEASVQNKANLRVAWVGMRRIVQNKPNFRQGGNVYKISYGKGL